MIDEFTRGYICAVSALVKGHGVNTEVKDLLGCLGKVKWVDLEDYDKEIFREAGLRQYFYPKLKRAQ